MYRIWSAQESKGWSGRRNIIFPSYKYPSPPELELDIVPITTLSIDNRSFSLGRSWVGYFNEGYPLTEVSLLCAVASSPSTKSFNLDLKVKTFDLGILQETYPFLIEFELIPTWSHDQPYASCHTFCTSMDTLEAGLCVPFYLFFIEAFNYWKFSLA